MTEEYNVDVFVMNDTEKKLYTPVDTVTFNLEKKCVEDVNFHLPPPALEGMFKVPCKKDTEIIAAKALSRLIGTKAVIYKRFNERYMGTMIPKWTPSTIPENAYDDDIKQCVIAKQALDAYLKITEIEFPLKSVFDKIMKKYEIEMDITYLDTYKVKVKGKSDTYWAQVEQNCETLSGFKFQKLLRNELKASVFTQMFIPDNNKNKDGRRTGASLHWLLMMVYILLFIYYTYVKSIIDKKKLPLLILDIQGCIGIEFNKITLTLTDPFIIDKDLDKTEFKVQFLNMYNEIIKAIKIELAHDKIVISPCLSGFIDKLKKVFNDSIDNNINRYFNKHPISESVLRLLNNLDSISKFTGTIDNTNYKIEAIKKEILSKPIHKGIDITPALPRHIAAAALERERERERVAAFERERERVASLERERVAAFERERVASLERERVASLERERVAEVARLAAAARIVAAKATIGFKPDDAKLIFDTLSKSHKVTPDMIEKFTPDDIAKYVHALTGIPVSESIAIIRTPIKDRIEGKTYFRWDRDELREIYYGDSTLFDLVRDPKLEAFISALHFIKTEVDRTPEGEAANARRKRLKDAAIEAERLKRLTEDAEEEAKIIRDLEESRTKLELAKKAKDRIIKDAELARLEEKAASERARVAAAEAKKERERDAAAALERERVAVVAKTRAAEEKERIDMKVIKVDNVKDREGNIYSGIMVKGVKNGYGVMKYANGDVYEGEWKDDEKYDGKMTYFGGKDTFEGYFTSGPRHKKKEYEWSQGVHTDKNNRTWDGQWDNGVMTDAKFTFDDGYYNGSFDENGRYSGENGTLYIESTDDTYVGNWDNGNITYGTHTNKNDDTYDGDFNDDREYHGQGTYTNSNGDKWEGYWENGNITSGDLTNDDGSTYNGSFGRNWKFDGRGTYTDTDGEILDGTWDNGNITYGTLTKANGDTYTGDFGPNGLFSGQGIYTDIDGESWEGEWKNGNIIYGDNKGFVMDDGDDTGNYHGEFNKQWEWHGQGALSNYYGLIFEGRFRNNKWK
jgi:hypothetical protein